MNHFCPIICCHHRRNDWTVYDSVERLSLCDEPMFLDFDIHAPLYALKNTVKRRACTASNADREVGIFSFMADSQRNEMPMINRTLATNDDLALRSPSETGEDERHVLVAFGSTQNYLQEAMKPNQDDAVFA